MNLTWKDAAATVLVVAAGVITYAVEKGFKWPLLTSWRLGSLALLVVGLATCIVAGSGVAPVKDGWTIGAGIMGGLAFVAGLLGIIFNKEIFFVTLAVSVMALWLVATVHHVVGASVRA